MTEAVVDACVSLKWALNDEEAVTQAIALRNAAIAGDMELVAPSLWLYEVINGLVVAMRRSRISLDVCNQATTAILAIGVRMVNPPARSIQQQAVRYGISAYDAAYLSLADALGTTLWTGDRRFYNTVSAHSARVRWIGDYS